MLSKQLYAITHKNGKHATVAWGMYNWESKQVI